MKSRSILTKQLAARCNPIVLPDEIPAECGVMLCEGDRLVVARPAPRKPMAHMPFHIWMSLAKATPVAHAGNKAARSAHEALVERVCVEMGRAGRLVWRGLSLRAPIPASGQSAGVTSEGCGTPGTPHRPDTSNTPDPVQWVMACPDVFSIRRTSVEAYLEPIVHEIKVSRADLVGDLKKTNKRAAYLGLGGECWYVLGQNAKGKPIARPDEVPPECGVMLCEGERLVVARPAPRKPMAHMPFHIWMSLAKATPVAHADDAGQAFL